MKKLLDYLPILIIGLIIANFVFNNKLEEVASVSSENVNNEIVVKTEAKNSENESDLYKYQIVEPSAAIYRIQKRFLNSEDQEVLGETTKISGIADFNLKDNTLNLFAEVDLRDLKSDNDARDAKVLDWFNPKTAKVTYKGKVESEIFFDEENVAKIPLNLEINSVEKEVPFDITYFVTDQNALIKGKATVKMSEFNIDPPSILNLYTADDEMELFFEVNLKAI